MKRRLVTMLFAGLLAMALWGCSLQEREQLDHQQTMRISAVLPHNDYGYWTQVADGIRGGAEGLPIDVKVRLPDINYNVDLMTELIRQEIAAQVDALIVQGIEDEDYIAALEKAREHGIRVVLVDTDLEDFQADLYVGTDNYAAGVEMGKRILEVTGRNANVAILSGAPGYPNLEERIQGIQDTLLPYPQVQILRLEYDQYDAMTVMEKYYQILREDPQIDTLVGVEGTCGQTLGQMNETHYSHTLVFDVGKETMDGLRNGMFDGVIGQQNYHMGEICTQQLYQHFTTGAFSDDKIYTDVTWITQENIPEEYHEEM